jgi:hypothetical protein
MVFSLLKEVDLFGNPSKRREPARHAKMLWLEPGLEIVVQAVRYTQI